MKSKFAVSSLIAFYQRHRTLLEWSYWPLVWSISALITASSVVMEYQRRGDALAVWEPFVWEFSSMATQLLALLLVIAFNRRFPLDSERLGRNLLAHLGFSVIYSLIHVVGMVQIRIWVYSRMGSSYDFGNWAFELTYEYRKDLLTYASILITIYIYRFLSSRLIGEATPISEGEDSASNAQPERLLVKKLGKEFLLRCDQIEWVEAAGNYMNLHSGGRVYPLRETMAGLSKRLDPNLFVRVHRSYMVNLDQVAEIEPLESGDANLRLRAGNQIRLSRRYRDELRTRLEAN